jgi:hypothetical protein
MILGICFKITWDWENGMGIKMKPVGNELKTVATGWWGTCE